MTKLFESRAVIEVLAPANDNTSQGLNRSQAEVLRLLRNDSLQDIAERFAHERKAQYPETLSLESLQKSVVCEPLEKSGLISIKARTRGKFDARDIVAFLIDSLDWRTNAPTKEERIEDQSIKKELMELKRRAIDLDESDHRQNRSGRRNSGSQTSGTGDGLLHDLATRSEMERTKAQISELTEKIERIHSQRESKRISIKVTKSPAISDRPAYPEIDTNLKIGRISGTCIALVACSCFLPFLSRKKILKGR